MGTRRWMLETCVHDERALATGRQGANYKCENFTFKETAPFQIQVSPALKHANALMTNHVVTHILQPRNSCMTQKTTQKMT